MPWGYEIVWQNRLTDSTRSVEIKDCKTSEEAECVAIVEALRAGYTIPKWWHFWRWSERPLPMKSLGWLRDLYWVIREVHREIGDDICWMDIDKIFKAVDLEVPDRKVGDKFKMLGNCHRFIETMCQDGDWIPYTDLEAENRKLKEELDDLRKSIKKVSGSD